MSTAAIFLWLGWALAAVATLLVAWALLWDRARGRRRCPRCWYDLAGAASLPTTCAECGRAILRERALMRTRRRWRWATLGTMLLLGSWFVAHTPAMREHGWAASVPTEVLVRWAPLWNWHTGGGGPPHSLRLELSRRASMNWPHGALSNRQKRLLLARHIDQFADESAPLVRSRPVWPEGVTPRVELLPHWWLKGVAPRWIRSRQRSTEATVIEQSILSAHMFDHIEYAQFVEPTGEVGESQDGGGLDLLLEVGERRALQSGGWGDRLPALWASPVRIPFQRADSIHDVVYGVSSIAMQQYFTDFARPELIIFSSGKAQLDLGSIYRAEPILKAMGDATLAVDVEVVRNGVVVGSGSAWWSTIRTFQPTHRRAVGFFASRIPLTMTAPSIETDDPAADEWRVRIASNPVLALNNFDSDRYWAGEAAMPLAGYTRYFPEEQEREGIEWRSEWKWETYDAYERALQRMLTSHGIAENEDD